MAATPKLVKDGNNILCIFLSDQYMGTEMNRSVFFFYISVIVVYKTKIKC